MNTKYSINEHFFENIDSEEKAYILGLISSDGNINDYTRDNHYRLRITLKSEDIDILEKTRRSMNFGGNIVTRQLKSHIRNTTNYYISELSISNKNLIMSLVELGITPNKTFTLQYPDIAPKLNQHFIRGFFDGDGSIYCRKDRKNGVNIELVSASYNFLNQLKNVLENELDLSLNLYQKNRGKNPVWVLKVSQSKARSILDYMYFNSTIHLDRKYEKYKELI